MIDTVLFDLDGTICDTNELILQSFKITLAEVLSLDEEKDTIYSYFGEPLDKSFSRYSNDIDEIENLVFYYRSFNEKNHDNMIKIFPGVKETLIALKKKNVKLGIVTSKRRKMAIKSLSRFNLEKYFTAIITPESTKLHKPNKAPVLEAMKVLNSKAHTTLMVGDSRYDIISGNSAGAMTCGVSYSVLKDDLISSKPDYMIDEIYEVLDIVNK